MTRFASVLLAASFSGGIALLGLCPAASLPPKQLESLSGDIRSGFHFQLSPDPQPVRVHESALDEPFIQAARQHFEKTQTLVTLRKIYQTQIRTAWEAEDFAALEDKLHQFKTVIGSELAGEEATQPLFYATIAEAAMAQEAAQQGFSAVERIQRWQAAYPQSLTPDLALGHYYLERAYEARGGESAADTPLAQLDAFKALALQGLRALDTAARQGKPLDAEFYTTQLRLLHCTGAPARQLQAAFDAGVRCDKDYAQLYRAMAQSVMPRWYGDSDDLVRLAEFYAAVHPTAHNRDGRYVRVVETVLWGVKHTPEQFLAYGFSWPVADSTDNRNKG